MMLWLPRGVAQGLSAAVGVTAFWILPKERLRMRRNLKQAFGDSFPDSEADRIGKNVFIHLGKTAADVFQFPRYHQRHLEKLVILNDGIDKMNQALALGKGVLGISGHLGNWELLAAYFLSSGYPGAVVGRRIYYEPFNRVLVALRKSVNVETIYRDGGLRRILKVLQGNGIVGMVVDQDVEKLDGVFVSFFGKPAWTPAAPVKISIATGAPILPMFVIREGNRYRLYIEDAICPEKTDNGEEAVQAMTQRWSDVVEKYVRRYPEQWVWMHDRWKTKPDLKLN